MNEKQDIWLTCAEGEKCIGVDIEGNSIECNFLWSAGEQTFMDKLIEEGKVKEVTPPKRCPDCRAKRKMEKEKWNSR